MFCHVVELKFQEAIDPTTITDQKAEKDKSENDHRRGEVGASCAEPGVPRLMLTSSKKRNCVK